MRSKIAIIICCSVAVSCAKWLKQKDDDEPATNGSTTMIADTIPQTTAVSCVPAVFPQTVPYSAGNLLPFAYEIPAGFGRVDESNRDAVTGTTFALVPPEEDAELINHYELSRTPAEGTEDLATAWLKAGAMGTTVEYGAQTLGLWIFETDDVVELRFFVPVDGEQYLASLSWQSDAECVDARAMLLELASVTLTPNADSAFPD